MRWPDVKTKLWPRSSWTELFGRKNSIMQLYSIAVITQHIHTEPRYRSSDIWTTQRAAPFIQLHCAGKLLGLHPQNCREYGNRSGGLVCFNAETLMLGKLTFPNIYSWAAPCRKFKIQTFKPSSTNIDSQYNLNVYERNVQVCLFCVATLLLLTSNFWLVGCGPWNHNSPHFLQHNSSSLTRRGWHDCKTSRASRWGTEICSWSWIEAAEGWAGRPWRPFDGFQETVTCTLHYSWVVQYRNLQCLTTSCSTVSSCFN